LATIWTPTETWREGAGIMMIVTAKQKHASYSTQLPGRSRVRIHFSCCICVTARIPRTTVLSKPFLTVRDRINKTYQYALWVSVRLSESPLNRPRPIRSSSIIVQRHHKPDRHPQRHHEHTSDRPINAVTTIKTHPKPGESHQHPHKSRSSAGEKKKKKKKERIACPHNQGYQPNSKA